MNMPTKFKIPFMVLICILFSKVSIMNCQSITYLNSISYIPQSAPTNSNSILQIV